MNSSRLYPQELTNLISALPLQATLSKAENGGYFIYSDELPGCFAAGSSMPAAFEDFKEALFEYYEVPKLYRKPDALLYASSSIPDPKSLRKPENFCTEIDQRLAFA